MRVNWLKVTETGLNVLGVTLSLIILSQWGFAWGHFLLILAMIVTYVAYGVWPSCRKQSWRIRK